MTDGHGDDTYKYRESINWNFSSNVYNPSEGYGALHDFLCRQMDAIHRYPEPEPYTLERELAQKLGLHNKEVCVTNGATEAIYLLAQAFRGNRSAILMPTFSEYADACRLHAHTVLPFYTTNQLPDKAQLVWLCNPNNPTGTVFDKRWLEQVIGNHPEYCFIIDQSYEAFTLRPLFTPSEAAAYPNLVLIHSMTKRFGIPGLRIGYLTASPTLLEEVRRQRMPWSVNQLAILAGCYLLTHKSCFPLDLPALLREKDRVASALASTGIMEVWPSDTHLLLVQLRIGRAPLLKEFLVKEHGILIRDASNFQGLDDRFFRIAVQSPAANDELIRCIQLWTLL